MRSLVQMKIVCSGPTVPLANLMATPCRAQPVVRSPGLGPAGAAVQSGSERSDSIRDAPAERSWRVDETYIRVAGQWTHFYRAIDSAANTIDFLLSPRRDVTAAKAFIHWRSGKPAHSAPCHQC